MPHKVFKEKGFKVAAERQNTQWLTGQTSSSGAQGAQPHASAEHWFPARRTRPMESSGSRWRKLLHISVHGHLKSALAWKNKTKTKPQRYLWHAPVTLSMNPVVIHQPFCVTHRYTWKETPRGWKRQPRLCSCLWPPCEASTDVPP